jgi:hypothetical protein
LLRALPNRLPESLLGQTLPLLDALPGAVEHGLKTRRTPQHEPFQIIVIVRNQQNGGGLAIACNDQRACDATFV